MAIGAAAVFVGATVFGAVEAKKREKRVNAAQERERAAAAAIQQNQARQSIRKQIREARVKQAQVQQQALATGQEGSSAAIAAQTALTTALGSNIGSVRTAQQTAGIRQQAQLDVFKAGQRSDLERAADITAGIAGRFAS